jgi:hypothetical protein
MFAITQFISDCLGKKINTLLYGYTHFFDFGEKLIFHDIFLTIFIKIILSFMENYKSYFYYLL